MKCRHCNGEHNGDKAAHYLARPKCWEAEQKRIARARPTFCNRCTCGRKVWSLKATARTCIDCLIRRRRERQQRRRQAVTCTCGKAFKPTRVDQRHCSGACRQREYRQRKARL
jgi:hypothetical protein